MSIRPVFNCLFFFGLAVASTAAAPFRLFEVSVARFSRDALGQGRIEVGRLNALGQFRSTHAQPTVLPGNMPVEALDKLVIHNEAWAAFASLGPEATANFELLREGVPYRIGTLLYYGVRASEDARVDVGQVVNLSTRGRVTSEPAGSLIGGFVITEQHRRVLIRAIGPSLLQHGVPDAAADVYLTVYRGNTPHYFNGNWGDRPDADEIAAISTAVGAFPLTRSSKDAALLLELQPGVYTAHVVTEGGAAPGNGMLEIYIVP